MAACVCERAVSDTRSNYRSAILSIERALEDGKVDTVVHTLLLALGNPLQTESRRKRERTLSQAFAKLEALLALQKQPQPLAPQSSSPSSPFEPGACDDDDSQSAILSYSQLQMFALHRLQPESSAYNIVRAVQITHAPFDERALHWTLAALLAKHDVLRTVYSTDAYGEPRQRVLPLAHFVDTLSGGECRTNVVAVLRIEDEPNNAAAWIASETGKPFDLSRDAPVRVRAVVTHSVATSQRSTAAPWTLAVALHHIATDPTSSQLFWSDFAQIYSQTIARSDVLCAHDGASKAATVARLEQYRIVNQVQYRDYARWQRERLRSGVLAQSLQYWIDALTPSDSDDGGSIPILELPFDTDRAAATQDVRSDVVVFRSTPALHDAFAALCATRGCSPFIGLLAVFQLLLSRLACCDDIVIGVPTVTRSHEALARVLGYFVNTLPFRIRSADPDATFDAFLASVRSVVLDGFTHMEIPLQMILEHVAIERDSDARSTAQHGLYQVMFSWESGDTLPSSGSVPVSNTDTLGIKDIALPLGAAKFDLMLSMRATVDSANERVLEGSMEFPAALFRRDTVVRFTEYFLTLLREVTADPLKPLHTISMLSERERHTLLYDWGTPAAHPSDSGDDNDSALLDEYLLAQVLASPQSTALRFEGTEWTYAELWAAGERVRDALRTFGVTRGDHIALFLDRGLENVAAMLGALQLHAVFVPLDTEFPPDRIKYMVHDSSARVIVTQAQHASKLSDLLQLGASPTGRESSCVKLLLWEELHRWCSPSLPPATHDDYERQLATLQPAHDTVAYVLYTSGSTGRPKGVMVTHTNLLTTLRWTVRQYAVSSTDIFLQSTSSTLDGSLTQLFSPLLVGASAVITKKNGLHDMLYMHELLARERISFCVFVPSYFALLLDSVDAFPAHVKHVVLAGETFPTALAKKFYEKHAAVCSHTRTRSSPTCLVNEYGPTEASVTSTFFKLPCEIALGESATAGAMLLPQSVPIGRPIDDHYVAVLDAHKRLVPMNVPGELYLGGRGVARGYWSRPELTAANFEYMDISTADASNQRSLARMRWYRTGDRVKWLATGELLFLGRTDAQVKLRGMRVELYEIRSVLLAHAHVKDAEVVVTAQQTALVAFVLLRDESRYGWGEKNTTKGATAVLCELRSFLTNRLPMHMVPHEIRVVDDWPRMPNGKLDVRALVAVASTISRAAQSPAASQAAAAAASHHPDKDKQQERWQEQHRSEMDDSASLRVRIAIEILTHAWSEVLSVADQQLLRSASFFELGGNSLTAIRVVALVKTHGLAVTLETFFRCKTLDEMAHAAAASLDVVAKSARTSDAPPAHALVPLNWKQSLQSSPLFIVHCADGTVWKLLELASRLPFPVIGVQAAGDRFADSVEELAARYWREIRAAQPQGPYALGGYSFGCRVAHEIARVAHTEGHSLVPLTLLDGVPCSLPRAVASRRAVQSSTLVSPQHDSDSDANGFAYVMRTLDSCVANTTQDAGQVSWSSGSNISGAAGDADVMQQLAAQYRAHCKLDAIYEPYETESNSSSPEDVPVSLMLLASAGDAQDVRKQKRDAWLRVYLYKTAQWELDDDERRLYRDCLGIAIDVFDVPGSHSTLLQTPHVAHVASAVAGNCDANYCT